MEKKRVAWIDMAKAIGILIVLINHAELNLGWINRFGGMFYMPLFFVTAGMTFRLKEDESFGTFAKKKAKRLLLPYLIANVLLFLFFFVKDSVLARQVNANSFLPLLGIVYARNQLFAPQLLKEGVSGFPLMTILNAPTWFLPCLFLALLIFAGIERLKTGYAKKGEKERGRYVAYALETGLLLLAVLIHYFCPILLPWSIDTALVAVAYMELGKIFAEGSYAEKLAAKKWKLLPVIVLFVLATIGNGAGNLSVGLYGRSVVLSVIGGITGSVLVLMGMYGIDAISDRTEKLSEHTEKLSEHTDKSSERMEKISRRMASLRDLLLSIGGATLRILCAHLFIFEIVRMASGYIPYITGSPAFLRILMITAVIVLLVKGSLKAKAEGILWVLLLTWYMPIINKGIDVQDTCFYLTNFRYVFTPSVKVNELYYLFGEVLGGIVYHIFPGHELLALNWICAAVYTGVAVLTYEKLRDRMNRIVLLLCVLGGSMFAITWVHCINWNAWSVLFAVIGAWILLDGLKKQSAKLIFVSGLVLGLNTFVRLPNLLFLSLVLVIVWNGLFCEKQTIKQTVLRCIPMVIGGAIAGVFGTVISYILLGKDKFLEDIVVLLGIGADGDLHSVTTGIYQFLIGLIDGASLWIRRGLILAAVLFVLYVIERLLAKRGKGTKLFLPTTAVIGALYGMATGMILDVISVQLMVAVLTLGLTAVGMFVWRKKDPAFSALCFSVLLMEGFLTIGTDTAAIYYRVMLGLPLAMSVCIILRAAKQVKVLAGAAAFITALVCVSGFNYANTYMYHDAVREECTAFADNSIFTGVYTSPERAECLNRLEEQLEPYADLELITIGNFTAAQAMTDMKPFFRSSWPDLDYLTDELFEETLEEKLSEGIYPVVIIATEKVNGAYWMPEKVEILEELVSEAPYTCIYEDELYSLHVPVM